MGSNTKKFTTATAADTTTTITATAAASGVPRNFVQGGGVQQIQLRTEERENGDLGVVAP